MPVMRAKMQVTKVEKYGEPVTSVSLALSAVTTKPFDTDGNSEDNTFSKWTPTASLGMSITNPALFDTFEVGQKFYVDFTAAES